MNVILSHEEINEYISKLDENEIIHELAKFYTLKNTIREQIEHWSNIENGNSVAVMRTQALILGELIFLLSLVEDIDIN